MRFFERNSGAVAQLGRKREQLENMTEEEQESEEGIRLLNEIKRLERRSAKMDKLKGPFMELTYKVHGSKA